MIFSFFLSDVCILIESSLLLNRVVVLQPSINIHLLDILLEPVYKICLFCSVVLVSLYVEGSTTVLEEISDVKTASNSEGLVKTIWEFLAVLVKVITDMMIKS